MQSIDATIEPTSFSMPLSTVFATPRSHPVLIERVYRFRGGMFGGRRKWRPTDLQGREIDDYDRPDTLSIVVVDAEGRVVGSVRLLPTLGPHMLPDRFSVLLGGRPCERSANVWECSRFAVAARRGGFAPGLHPATRLLFLGMGEWARGNGVRRFVTVTTAGLLRLLPEVKWTFDRYTDPIRIGDGARKVLSVAGAMDVPPLD